MLSPENKALSIQLKLAEKAKIYILFFAGIGVSSDLILFIQFSLIEIQQYIIFRHTTQLFDICIYCEIITTMNLVDMENHT